MLLLVIMNSQLPVAPGFSPGIILPAIRELLVNSVNAILKPVLTYCQPHAGFPSVGSTLLLKHELVESCGASKHCRRRAVSDI